MCHNWLNTLCVCGKTLSFASAMIFVSIRGGLKIVTQLRNHIAIIFLSNRWIFTTENYLFWLFCIWCLQLWLSIVCQVRGSVSLFVCVKVYHVQIKHWGHKYVHTASTSVQKCKEINRMWRVISYDQCEFRVRSSELHIQLFMDAFVLIF